MDEYHCLYCFDHYVSVGPFSTLPQVYVISCNFLTESFAATPIASLSYTWSFIGIKTILPWKNTFISICNICLCSQKCYWLVWKNSIKNFFSHYRKTSPYIIDLNTMFSIGLLLFFSSIYSVKHNLAECFSAPTFPQFPSLSWPSYSVTSWVLVTLSPCLEWNDKKKKLSGQLIIKSR